MTSRPRVRFAIAMVLAVYPLVASADITRSECIEANTQAQGLRRDGKLLAARDQLKRCVDAACPAMVRDDCARRLDELERAQPTIVFDARDAEGRDLTEVRVAIDGRALAERLDGRALAADPGEHTFVFTVAGQQPVTRRLVLRESEKERREQIMVGGPEAARTGGGAVAPPTQASTAPSPSRGGGPGSSPAQVLTAPFPASTPGNSHKTFGLLIGAAGVAGVAAGGVFGLVASAKWNSSKSECNAQVCTDHGNAVADHDSAESAAAVSTIAFVAGGALLATGIVLFATAPSGGETAGAAGWEIAPSFGHHAAGLRLRGRF